MTYVSRMVGATLAVALEKHPCRVRAGLAPALDWM